MGRGSNNPKTTDNGPVLAGLRAMGYARPEPYPGGRDGFVLRQEDGTRLRVKIQKRNGSERAAGQHSFGVCHLDFPNVDSFVFWVRGLRHVLIVPTARLSEVFHEYETSNTFANPRQWEVVFHFEDNGQAFMEPIGSGVQYDISEHCMAWPQAAV